MSQIPSLVRDLIDQSRHATNIELQQLIQHVAQASFSSRPLKINHWLRTELENRGVHISSSKYPSVEIHLMKRIYLDEQWPPKTTVKQFVADLHTAVQHPKCKIWTYRWFHESFAGFMAPSHMQKMPKSEKFIFIAYSADYDRIKTGYQTSGPEAVFTDEFEQRIRHC